MARPPATDSAAFGRFALALALALSFSFSEVAWAQRDPCRQYATCSSCASVAECGWCAGTRRCVSARSAARASCGPSFIASPAACFAPSAPPPPPPQQQPPSASDACAPYTSCDACTGQPSCGWCAASNRCMTGGQNGAPGCAGGWTWVPAQCGGAGQGGTRR